MQTIALYIGNREVDLGDDFKILMTYTSEETTEPTAVKNSYSKTVKVEGTRKNNQLFSDLWNVQAKALTFSVIRKNPFVLYCDGEVMESGYCRLNRINRVGEHITYELSLFGGLGDFFYSLSTDEQGEKRKLSDLDFGGGEKEFDMLVTKETVKAAWNSLTSTGEDIYKTINFAPCRNGKPEDFATDTVCMDMKDNPLAVQPLPSGPSNAKGVFVTKTEGEYDEWASGDLRAYNQRPVLRMKSLIKAICDPRNNGGYTVDLDSSFFNRANPYYEKSWVTLPLISDTDPDSEDVDERLANSYRVLPSTGLVTPIHPTVATKAGNRGTLALKLQMNVVAEGGWDRLFNSASTVDLAGPTQEYASAFFVQLVARDSDGNAVYGSEVQMLTSSNQGYTMEDFGYVPVVKADCRHIFHDWARDGESSRYIFPAQTLSISDFLLSSNMTFELRVEKKWKYRNIPQPEWNTFLRDRRNNEHPGNLSQQMVTADVTVIAGDVQYKESSLSKIRFSKKRMLGSGGTPLQYLLGYTKQMGLLFIKDKVEKKISIVTRNTFYKGQGIVNIDELLDRDTVVIKPVAFDHKYYDFKLKASESRYERQYFTSHDIDYGIQRVNTGYDYDNSSKNLLKDVVYRNAVMARYRTPYNVNLRAEWMASPVGLPSMYIDGAQAFRFVDSKWELEEKPAVTLKATKALLPQIYRARYYDRMPLMCFEDGEGRPVDGANVLCFYNSMVSTKDVDGNDTCMRLSDDDAIQMRAGGPCWRYGDTSTIHLDTIPLFSRYYASGLNVMASFNMGSPRETYTYDYSFSSNATIYDRSWKRYVADIYDENTRVVTAKVLLGRQDVADCLRKIWCFDGCRWVMTKVKDYDVSSPMAVECEFVKVQDIEAYTSGQTAYEGLKPLQ